ncbi:MAG TPA: hypothetical protein VKG26_06570 [Bacteroidia bacterium]|nr:hypothetical protein [Bacteroidia bacterium]
MSTFDDNKKMSLSECRKILCENGKVYTDDEVIKVRDYLYHLADLAIDALDKNANVNSEQQNKNKGRT